MLRTMHGNALDPPGTGDVPGTNERKGHPRGSAGGVREASRRRETLCQGQRMVSASRLTSPLLPDGRISGEAGSPNINHRKTPALRGQTGPTPTAAWGQELDHNLTTVQETDSPLSPAGSS